MNKKDKKAQIIELYDKKVMSDPPLDEIAKKVGVTRQYVSQVIKIYKLQNAAFGIKK